MPKQRMSLPMIKDVIRLKWHAQLSYEQIATTLKVSKGAVAKYVSLATVAGLDWETVQHWNERQLSSALLPRAATSQPFVEPDWGRIHRELDRKGMTLMLLWQEYVAAHPDGRTWRYTQFCEHYKEFARTLKRSMRQHRRAGEKLFIDFAGPTVPLSDGARAQVFASAMAASSYVFACATPAQRLDDWIDCMVRALHFYGGVPQLIVPDNARAVIASPDRYEPRANDTVLDFARYYGTSVLAARPRTPRDKATAESSVQVVTRWVLARLRHHRFDTVAQVDAAITELLSSVNDRPFQKLPGSRASVFAELDAPTLMSLPRQPYELARFKTVKVHIVASDNYLERLKVVDAGQHRLPRRAGGPPLQRAACARRPGPGGAPHPPRRGVAAAWPARGRPRSQRAPRRLHHGGGPHACCPPRPPGVDASAADRLGPTHRHGMRRTHHPAAADLQASRTRLPLLPGTAEPVAPIWRGTVGGGLRTGPRSGRLPLPPCARPAGQQP